MKKLMVGVALALLPGTAVPLMAQANTPQEHVHGPSAAPAQTPDSAAAGHGEHHAEHHAAHHGAAASGGAMWMRTLPGGVTVMGMGQLFPIATFGAGREGSAFQEEGAWLSQGVGMVNLSSSSGRWVLRATPNIEGFTQREGEFTPGGWGEGFIDSRHPHTLVHELMLSVLFPTVAGGDLSISGGKGFAPYGTDDPMSRPGVKYPTNHHLSQILERWTVNGAWLSRGVSVEGGVFGGSEPESPWDFSNVSSFPDSWSGRVAVRPGSHEGSLGPLELSVSHGRVREEHHGEAEVTALTNLAARFQGARAGGELYGLVEYSWSSPEHGEGYRSLLGEVALDRRGHRPYLRGEWATRPEFAREGPRGTEGFFRYDHDDEAIGATRWAILTAGWGVETTPLPWSLRPFAELQYFRVAAERGGIRPVDLYGASQGWALTLGSRIFLGGGPMRMGSYGVLDPMVRGHDGHAGHTGASDSAGHAGHGSGGR